MAIAAFSGPVISFGQNNAGSAENNPDLAPSMFWGGTAVMDPRTVYAYTPGQRQGSPSFGWCGVDNITTLCVVPSTKKVSGVVLSANPTTAALTLVAGPVATTGNIYMTPSIINALTGAVDTGVAGGGLLVLDAYASVTTCTCTLGVLTVGGTLTGMPIGPGMKMLTASGTVTGTAAGTTILFQLTGGTAGLGGVGTYQTDNPTLSFTTSTCTFAYQNPFQCGVPFGAANGYNTPTVYLWNPMAMCARTLGVTTQAAGTYATATIAGYDVYGFPMTEAITLSAGSQVAGLKAWKYVRSVTLSGGTPDTTHAYSVDTLDVFGLPLRSDTYGDITVNYATSLTASTLVAAATGYLPADRTLATSATGDVRGTFVAAANNNTNKLIVRQSVNPYNIGFNAGMFGVTQA